MKALRSYELTVRGALRDIARGFIDLARAVWARILRQRVWGIEKFGD